MVLMGKSEERRTLEGPSVDGRIILKWIFEWDGKRRSDYSGSGKGQLAGWCEYGNELPASIKCREILE